MPKVSIIVPVYNTARYLHECVDSLLGQTLQDIEIILVDDGSTDDSPRICDEYAERDNRVRVIHQSNSGLSAARNRGIEAAQGEWFAFVDSDDVCDSRMYADMYCAATEAGVPLVVCSGYYFSDDSKMEILSGPQEKCANVIISSEDLIRDKLWTTAGNTVLFTVVWNKLYHRSLLAKLEFREDVKIAEDECFATELFKENYPIVWMNDSYYGYRMVSNSLSHKPFCIEKCIILHVLAERNEQYHQRGLNEAARKAARNFCEVYIEYYMKAKQIGQGKSVTIHRPTLKAMRTYIWKSIPLKTKIRYIIFDVSPWLYEHFIR